MEIPIKDTAFYRYLKFLNERDRVLHLLECLKNEGELYQKLCEHFDCYDPMELAKLITKEEYK